MYIAQKNQLTINYYYNAMHSWKVLKNYRWNVLGYKISCTQVLLFIYKLTRKPEHK